MSDKEKLNKAAADCSAGKYKEGAAEFHVLADEGCPFAQCILRIMYQNGRGVSKNVHPAIGWYSKSAKQGYSVAEEHLGEIYQYGEQGTRADSKQAVNWYRGPAYHGNGKVQLALFKMPPIGTPGTLADDWKGIVQLEKSLSANTKKEMDKFSGH